MISSIYLHSSFCFFFLTEVDTRICTTEQRKLDLSEMRQRTRRYLHFQPSHKVQSVTALITTGYLSRLYQQLEEVQQQKAVRSRREASTQNRLKAKEFHKVIIYWSTMFQSHFQL